MRLSLDNTQEAGSLELPPRVACYEVNGPLFFGAAQSAMEALHASHGDTFDVLVLHLGRTPVIDATGFAALEAAIEALIRRKKTVVLAGPLPHPRRIFDKANLLGKHGALRMTDDLGAALGLARDLAGAAGADQPPPRAT